MSNYSGYTREEFKQLPIQEGVMHGPFPPLTEEDILEITENPDWYGYSDEHTLHQARHQYSEQYKAIEEAGIHGLTQYRDNLEAGMHIYWRTAIQRQERKSRQEAYDKLGKVYEQLGKMIVSPPIVKEHRTKRPKPESKVDDKTSQIELV